VLAASGLALDAALPGGAGESVGEALLQPHRWYGRSLLPLLPGGAVHAMAHVTGGGIAGNLVRVLPEGMRAHVRATAWPRPAVFGWLMAEGGVPEGDAREALNLGVGMVVVSPADRADGLAASLVAAGETVWALGEVRPGLRGVEWDSA
jgi:phosphoribosylformylglycinamidine cyclo-ligase